ncbi:MAG TPA: DUF1674 domain-containing protein [Alphaproteobacteria bacterium]|nr:DUF1674 domain-containing protein [Alphaproteobacteria bacterium]
MKEHKIQDAPRRDTGRGHAKPSPEGWPQPPALVQKPGEIGGRDGPEPTRYGDWEVNGRCTDF